MIRINHRKLKLSLSFVLVMIMLLNCFSVLVLAADSKVASGGSIASASVKAVTNTAGASVQQVELPEKYNETEINNSFTEADVINSNYIGSPKYTISGMIDDVYSDVDYYAVTVNLLGTLSLNGIWIGEYYGQGWENDLFFELCDSSYNLLETADLIQDGTSASLVLNSYVTPGTYFIKVHATDLYEYLYVGQFYNISMSLGEGLIFSFNSQGGTSVDPVVATYNSLVNEPDPPTKYGYTFSGWYRDMNYTTPWNFDTDVARASRTLYAKWKLNSYDVTFMDGTNTLKVESVLHGDYATAPPPPTHPGEVFTGWDVPFTNVTSALTVTAKFSPVIAGQFYVVFTDWNGSPLGDAQTVALNGNATPPADPSRTGYDFTDWDGIYTNVTANLVIKAKYQELIFTVNFDANGGSNSDPLFRTTNFNGTVALPTTNPEKTGHSFIGWNTDRYGYGDTFMSSTRVTANTVVYAQYSIKNYTVTFDKNGGETNIDPFIFTMPYHSEIAIPATTPSRVGYTFIRWNTEKDGTGTTLAAGSRLIENTVYYAKWQINKYTVTFYKNGGDTSPVPGTVQTDYNTPLTAMPTPPTKTGYSFVGWNTKADGSGAPFTASTLVTADIPVYAQFEINQYTVTFSNNGGDTEANPTSIEVDFETTVKTLPGEPTRAGYQFLAWNTKADGSGTIFTASTQVTANMIVYARWLTSPVLGLTAKSAGYKSIKLTWPAATGAAGYKLYRSTTPTGFTNVPLKTFTTNTTLSYTDLSLVTGKPYYYRVRAYAMVGSNPVEGLNSDIASAVPVLATPASIAAKSASYNSIRLSWGSNPEASGYVIYRSTTSGGTYAQLKILAGAAITSYVDGSLATGKAYFYKVKAYRQISTTTKIFSANTFVKSAIPVPAIPGSFLVARASVSSIKISWAAVSGATGYEIYQATSASGTYALIKTTTSISYIKTGLVKGKYYYYKVRAYRQVSSTKKVFGLYTAIKYAKPY
jgi:uncharacterized repeat protein (TIGR02543 family)